MTNHMQIGNHGVGPGEPVFIIAEASSNHGRDIGRAKQMIDVAVGAGADAVKFQLFRAEAIAADTSDPRTIVHPGEEGALVTESRKLVDLYRDNELPRSWIPELASYAAERGITFLATPFDEEAIDLLERLDAPGYKIASYELLDVPLLRRVARTRKPIIISTGMATLADIEASLEVLSGAGATDIAVLHCHSGCPVAPEDVNLEAMRTISRAFRRPVGYSDHTRGLSIPIAAAALGAAVIEKHFVLDDGVSTVDAHYSVGPRDLAIMVGAIRDVEKALGNGVKRPTHREQKESQRGRRSLWVIKDMSKGQQFSEENTRVLRPGIGLSPLHYDLVMGARAARDIPANTALEWHHLLFN